MPVRIMMTRITVTTRSPECHAHPWVCDVPKGLVSGIGRLLRRVLSWLWCTLLEPWLYILEEAKDD